ADVEKITSDQEIAALQRILQTRHLAKAARQSLERQIFQLQHQDQGSLSLSLGNIKLPSPYEIKRAALASRNSNAVTVNNSPTVHVHVHENADARYVLGVIDDHLGTSARSGLRAAGAL
ncbi:MAG: hypothetical protein QOJ29_892, partial [Thermoleophilaceae bacterium]|nr:hypothetical protein [Thermoleophilaceae bacterium]